MGEADVEDATQNLTLTTPATAPQPSPAQPPAQTEIDWQPPFEGTPPSRLDLFIDGAELVSIRDLTDGLHAVTLRARGRDWTFHARIATGRNTAPGPTRFFWISIHEARLVGRPSKEPDQA